MMEQAQLRSYQADKDLLNCGLTQESINAIKATTVITRDGAQHVVPTAQSHLNEAPNTGTVHVSEESNSALQSLQQQMNDQQRMFSRFKQFADGRIMQLEKQMTALIEHTKEQAGTIMTMRSNMAARQAQAETLESSYASEAKEEKTQEIKQSAPRQQAKKGIDRNKVNPNDVQVENIFYCGTR